MKWTLACLCIMGGMVCGAIEPIYGKERQYTTAIENETMYTITVEAEHGTIIGGGEFAYGTEIQLEAIPDAHYHFDMWADRNINNPRTIVVTENATYRAIFLPNIYRIEVRCNEKEGLVFGGGDYTYGEYATVSAVPQKGYQFESWSNIYLTENPYTFEVTGHMILDAYFIPATAIEETNEKQTLPHKIVRNGQVLIVKEKQVYNTMGIPVDTP